MLPLASRCTSSSGLLAIAWLMGCEQAEPSCPVQPERVAAAALTNGTARAEYLALEAWEEAAVVEIEANGALWCSGVLIAEHSVLTAKHCLQDGPLPALVARFGRSTDDIEFQTSARVLAVHPERDALVLQLDASPVAAIGVRPLPVARVLPSGLGPGSLVQTGGFGNDQDQASGTRAFLVEELVEIEANSLIVSAHGQGGACFGDSGGPLLVRTDTGQVATLGVLSKGSKGCYGIDMYTRADSLVDWLEQQAGLPSSTQTLPVRDDHAVLGPSGRCFDGTAAWSAQGRVRASLCEAGQRCGWSERSRGYRCVEPEADPCRGVGELGICDRGVAVHCDEGRLHRNECPSCGFACGRSPKTGRVRCLAPRAAADGG